MEKSPSQIMRNAVLPAGKFLIFCRVVFSEFWLNHCITRASALAFTLLLTIIPLMASLSFMLATMIEVHPKEVTDIVTLFLPFSPPTVHQFISDFFENAQKLRGVGTLVLIVFTVGLFGAVEETMSTIWKVQNKRSFFAHLRTFTMVIVWGPIFFIASFSLRQSGILDRFADFFFVFDILPSVLSVLGFVLLIWLMPNTRVRLQSALLGGLITGTLFELERMGFGSYIRLSIQTRTIYGAYGILPFFLVSLFFLSLFILIGAEIAYVHQNFRPLLKSKKRWDRRVTDYKIYISLRVLIDIVDAFTKRKPLPTLDVIMQKYELSEAQATGILNALIFEGYMIAIQNGKGYAPAFDISHTSVKEVLNKLENQSRKVPTIPDDNVKPYITEILSKLVSQTHPDLELLTFSRLIQELDERNAVPEA